MDTRPKQPNTRTQPRPYPAHPKQAAASPTPSALPSCLPLSSPILCASNIARSPSSPCASAPLWARKPLKQAQKPSSKNRAPYVVQLAQQQHITPAGFYAMKKPQKRALIAQTAHTPDEQILADYQQSELGYSFPSGHTTFSVAWLLLVVGFTQNWRNPARLIARVLVAAWAASVLYSRVKLGAHFPVDLFAATLMVWAWVIGIFRYALPYWHSRFGQPKHA